MQKTTKKFDYKLSKISENMRNAIKTITLINRFMMITTVLLYLTVILGLYAQIILGFTQVVSSLILLIFLNRLKQKEKKLLTTYFIITICFFLSWYYVVEFQQIANDLYSDIGLISMILIPMSIAIYFTYILEQIKETVI